MMPTGLTEKEVAFLVEHRVTSFLITCVILLNRPRDPVLHKEKLRPRQREPVAQSHIPNPR